MKTNPIYIISEQYSDSWNDNRLCDRVLTDTGYFVDLDATLAKAWEFVFYLNINYILKYVKI